MLTIQVTDTRLEAQLIEQAKAAGKSAQQLAEELLAGALNHLASPAFFFPALDPAEHSRLLQFDVDPSTDNAPAFQHVPDTIKFASALRQNAWTR